MLCQLFDSLSSRALPGGGNAVNEAISSSLSLSLVKMSSSSSASPSDVNVNRTGPCCSRVYRTSRLRYFLITHTHTHTHTHIHTRVQVGACQEHCDISYLLQYTTMIITITIANINNSAAPILEPITTGR